MERTLRLVLAVNLVVAGFNLRGAFIDYGTWSPVMNVASALGFALGIYNIYRCSRVLA